MKSLKLILSIFVFLVFGINAMASPDKYIIDSLINEIRIAPNDSVKIYLLNEISYLYENSDILSSINYAEQALEIATRSDNMRIKGYALETAGKAYFNQGMFEKAIVYYYGNLNIQKQLENKIGIATALSKIGMVKGKINDYEGSKSYLLQSLSIINDFELGELEKYDEFQMPRVLNILGVAYKNNMEFDSALICYREAIILSRNLGDNDVLLGRLYNNKGNVFLKLGMLDSAYSSLKKAQYIKIKNDNLSGLIKTNVFLAEYYLKTNQQDKAIKKLYNGLESARKIGSIDLQSIITNKLYLYYYMQNNADSALKYLILYKEYKDIINEKETLQELTRLELTLQFKEKQEIKRLRQKRLDTIYIFIVVGLVLTLFIFMLLFSLSRSRVRRLNLEKNNLFLESKNANLENENLQKELEIRNKELTTFVMGMIRKNEIISQIVDILKKNKESLENQGSHITSKIIKDLYSLQDESVWEEFEMRYEKVHSRFYEKLQKNYPSLSPNERRLCAFLKLNMTTKEIASITGQGVRSIEVARTRLRKKLNLTHSELGLIDFLSSL